MKMEQFGPWLVWFWHAYQAPVVAALALLGAAAALRVLRGTAPAAVAPALAAGVGWLVLLWRPSPDLLLHPRGWSERLLGVALAATVLALARPGLGGRVARWTPWLLFVLLGWWLATPLGARQEFWRVWLAVAVLAAVLARLVAGDTARSGAAALALWGSLLLLGSPVWAAVAAIPCAVAVTAMLSSRLTPLPPDAWLPFAAALASAGAAASLAGGFAVRGSVGPLDLAALAPVAAAAMQPVMAQRLPRLGTALASAATAGIIACAVWLLARALA